MKAEIKTDSTLTITHTRPTMADRKTTSAVYAAIRKRFESPAWALMFEVADATGARHSRWADAVALGLWPSRGLHLHGMEVKASRSDWVKELKTPSKAEPICRYCDFWWLVVAEESIVKDGELPANWGLLALNGKGLRTVKDAPQLAPETMSRYFLCGLLRSASTPSDRGQDEMMRKEYWRGKEEAEKSNAKTFEQLNKRHLELQQKVAEFERVAGFRLSDFNTTAGSRAELVREVINGRYDRDQNEVREIRRLAAGIVERIDRSGIVSKETEAA